MTSNRKIEQMDEAALATHPQEAATGDQCGEPEHFPIVGIGASAGGLEALEAFVSEIAVKSGMAFVVVSHSHPDHEMDINMSTMNGVEATRIINSELPDIRIIGLSMHEDADQAGAMKQAGAAAYLSKSCGSDILLAAIQYGHPVRNPKTIQSAGGVQRS